MRFRNFDGSGRPPRQVQTDILNWLDRNWDASQVLAINGPTGIGKQAIMRALQLEFGAAALVPTNTLLNQAVQTYPNLNYLKGREHYQCKVEGFSCHDRKILGAKPCEACPYVTCRKAALEGENTIFNPISYYYLMTSPNWVPPRVLVVDEAHKLGELLMLLTGVTFRKGYYNYPNITSEMQLIDWLKSLLPKLETKAAGHLKSGQKQEAVQTRKEAEKISNVLYSLTNNPQDYVFYVEPGTFRNKRDEYLHVAPIKPPSWLVRRVLKCDKLVLMSATLLESDLWDLGLSDYKYLDVPSPIPKEQRPVIYAPHSVPMDYQTPPEEIAKWIRGQIEKQPNRNTIVHLSYDRVDKVRAFFPGALHNTPENKDKVLAKFKAKGGLWLAAGCSEGIDLPGDECRLNLVPMILRGNTNDPVTKKQLAQSRGWLRYELTSLKTLIQQVGRSTRGIEDHSMAVVGDNRFPQLVSRNKDYMPKSFLEAIVWRSK